MRGALLVLLALSAPAAAASGRGALDAAIVCHGALDYPCAEARLAEALAGELTREEIQRARLYEARIALAYRDMGHARRAVRAILVLDPNFDHGPVTPTLAALFAKERPTPLPPPALMGRLDLTSVRLFGHDAERWTEGIGVEASVGIRFAERLNLEVSGGYSDHNAGAITVDGLDLWTFGVGAGWRNALGPVRLTLGGGVGLARAVARAPLRDTRLWGALLQAPIELSWPLWRGLGVGVRATPTLLLTEDDDRAAMSWLLPLMVGVRYGER